MAVHGQCHAAAACNSNFHIVSNHYTVSFVDVWMVQDMDFQGFFFLVCQA
jgi:hypothetical protein